ncbi:hypothetical protein HCH_05550 [Hahella chejuensis KCTC 2396]|uniref:Uncharacterized protein n=1 Tax=Hahella chejuensis (strain KCTC 2396) TaxID=349521 RepID=Q2SAW5_HAHCH|nr:hypothetical protein HCH_05550 [Hahella chejuensis KCTC 2396]
MEEESADHRRHFLSLMSSLTRRSYRFGLPLVLRMHQQGTQLRWRDRFV